MHMPIPRALVVISLAGTLMWASSTTAHADLSGIRTPEKGEWPESARMTHSQRFPAQKVSVESESARPAPLDLIVAEIIGQESERLALIHFKQRPMIVHKDMVVEGLFKVVDILPDRLIILCHNESNRRIFPIGGGKE